MTEKKAIILLSGGLDSTTILAMVRQQGYRVYALSFDYGQKHREELELAKKLAEKYGAQQHIVIGFDMSVIGGSSLTSGGSIPKPAGIEEVGKSIPTTYVPARNTIFLSFALAWAEVLECFDIFIGVNALDYSGYPDCRPQFIESYEKMANTAMSLTKKYGEKLTVHAPLLHMTKEQIIAKGLELGVDYAETVSCYDYSPHGACGRCDACLLRLRGFRQAGKTDPAPYRSIPPAQ